MFKIGHQHMKSVQVERNIAYCIPKQTFRDWDVQCMEAPYTYLCLLECVSVHHRPRTETKLYHTH